MLTRREKEVLTLLAQGHSNDTIGATLSISGPTVALHLSSARRRLGAKTREHAIALAIVLTEIDPAIEIEQGEARPTYYSRRRPAPVNVPPV